MSSCPPPERLAALLDDEDAVDDADRETLVDHLSHCASCRDVLQELSAISRDWQSYESMLGTARLAWPEPSGDQRVVGSAEHASAESGLRETLVGPIDNADMRTMTDPELSSSSRVNTSAPPSPAGTTFGDYELLSRIGSGGMGIVYRARQRRAGRIVALKLIRPERIETLDDRQRQAWLDRFRAEAQTAARMEHDHVVTVYEVGEQDGTLFYSMQLIEGPTMSDLVREKPLENRRAARMLRDVARAVDHAHRQGILHRDLKPQNILIRKVEPGSLSASEISDSSARASHGGESPGERPVVADFGLAKFLEPGVHGATHTGEVMGSPSYMSPEQAKDASRCTAASDIYSLGATLYDALTGRPPFRASSPVETLRQVIDQEPVAPRDLNPAIDPDLQTVTLKALAKDPARRYSSAAELADDLQRYIDGQPIKARPVGPIERAYRWFRRNPTVASLATLAGLLLLVVAVGSAIYSVMLKRYAEREHQARTEAEEYFRMTRGAIDQMLTEVGEESLAHVPLMDSVRRKLLTRALELHRRLLDSQPSHPALQLEFARAFHRMGDIHELLGEHEQAKAAYLQSIEHCRRLRSRYPDDLRVRHYLAFSHTMLGECLRKTEPAEAGQHYETALELQRELLVLAPEDHEYQRERTRTLNNMGLSLTETGRHAEAEAALKEAIAGLEALAEAEGSAEVLADLGRSRINLGVLLRQASDRQDEAEQAYRGAIDVLRVLVAKYPEHREYEYKLAVAMLDLGNLLTESPGRGADSLPWTREANEKLEDICRRFPGIPRYLYELANSCNSLAVSLARSDRRDDAKSEFAEATRVLDRLSERFPDYATTVANYSSLRGRVLGGTGFLCSKDEDWPAALTLVEQAIACQQEAVRLGPENPDFVDFAGQHHTFLATVLERLDRPQQAEQARDEAESLARRARQMRGSSAGESVSDASR